jgi:hypothetical protein
MAPSGGAPAPAAAPGSTEIPYIDDPVSRIWVAAVVGLFVLVFAYAALLGHGGILTPKQTPIPLATPRASVTVSSAPSAGSSGAPASGAPASGAASSPAPASAGAGGTPSPAASSGAASSGKSPSPAVPTPSPS